MYLFTVAINPVVANRQICLTLLFFYLLAVNQSDLFAEAPKAEDTKEKDQRVPINDGKN